MVPYDVVTDTFGEVEEDDPRIVDAGLFPTPAVHTEFGDGYVFLHFLESTGPGKVLRGVFQKEADYQRVFSHIYHTVMKNSERVRCDVFLERSFIRHPVPKVPTSCLKGDTAYCAMMGADRIRTGFFKAYVKFMRKAFPGFGKACYVDSAPLPNDTDDDPFDAFADHGTGSSGNRMRMAVVLDSKMGLPVWFDIHSGDVLDLGTPSGITADIRTNLGIGITEYVLDAGYASGKLIRSFPTTVEGEESDPADTDDDVGNIVVRMPARRGHPYKTPYHRCKPLMGNGKYDLVRDRHAYFGVRKRVRVFEKEVCAYVYVDYGNALRGHRRFMSEHPSEFEAMTDEDRTWHRCKEGYFILLSGMAEEPSAMLERYFGRTGIECIFRTAKEYLEILPPNKWTVDTVKGKILNDAISLIPYLGMGRALSGSGYSVPEVISRCRSLECMMTPDGVIGVEVPNKQMERIYSRFHMTVPPRVALSEILPCSG